MKYPYFRGLEADRYSFYRVPKALIKVDLFEKMSGDAKLLYSRKTKLGRVEWNPGTLAGVLANERHCGDVLARKTFTPNFLTHLDIRGTCCSQLLRICGTL